jgi:hypothetical protein
MGQEDCLEWHYRVTQHRFVFSRGDFVAFGGGVRYAKVTNIFTHVLEGVNRPFLVVDEFIDTGNRDELLDMRMFEKNETDLIIGLPSVSSEFLYMPQFGGSQEITLLNEWHIKFL